MPSITFLLVTLIFNLPNIVNAEAIDELHLPNRLESRLPKRAPGRDFGVFQPDCRGAESACNNACFYIHCQAKLDPDANKIVYVGGDDSERTKNRLESGCRTSNPRAGGGSVCRNFPFSQVFSRDQTWECDEWPPAMHQQKPFAQKTFANSLRCMSDAENRSLGGKLGSFVRGNGNFPGRPVGQMQRDDYFRVDFLANIGTADQTKVPYCLGPQPVCTQDGFQFGLTSKTITGGKLTAPYDYNGDDNRYALQESPYKDVYQCGVSFSRHGDNDFKDIVLTNFANSHMQTSSTCVAASNGASCTLSGLPNDLIITRNGSLGTDINFEYGLNSINHFTWTSASLGSGRGPWTDPIADPGRQPDRFCKVKSSSPNVEDTECWFPCYRNADGR